MVRFDVDRLRREIEREQKRQNEKQSKKRCELLGLPIDKAILHLKDGQKLNCKVVKIGRYEICVENNGKQLIVFKHAINFIEPIS